MEHLILEISEEVLKFENTNQPSEKTKKMEEKAKNPQKSNRKSVSFSLPKNNSPPSKILSKLNSNSNLNNNNNSNNLMIISSAFCNQQIEELFDFSLRFLRIRVEKLSQYTADTVKNYFFYYFYFYYFFIHFIFIFIIFLFILFILLLNFLLNFLR